MGGRSSKRTAGARPESIGRWPRALADARTALLKMRPYLATALFAVRPVAAPGTGGFFVDRWWRLYYDPALLAMPLAELAGALYHEVWHLLRDHADRRGEVSVSDMAWALGTDLEINDSIVAEEEVVLETGRGGAVVRAKVKLPPVHEALVPGRFGLPDGKSAEGYARALDDGMPGAGGAGGSGAGDGANSGGAGSASGQDAAPDADTGGGADAGPGQAPEGGDGDNGNSDGGTPGHPHGGCGSGAGCAPQPWELGPPHGDLPGVGEIEGDMLRRETAREVVRAAKQAGNVPAGIARWAEAVLNPQVPWQQVLAQALRRALGDISGTVDFSYRRPSRRQAAFPNAIMPALRRPDGPVAVVVDTSGSMADADLSAALAEIKGVIEASGREVTVLACDAAVHACETVTDARRVRLAGGGGTDMGAGLETAGRLRPRPALTVVLTDGYTPWPKQKPAGLGAVMVVLIGTPETNAQVRGDVPPWVWRTTEISPAATPEAA